MVTSCGVIPSWLYRRVPCPVRPSPPTPAHPPLAVPSLTGLYTALWHLALIYFIERNPAPPMSQTVTYLSKNRSCKVHARIHPHFIFLSSYSSGSIPCQYVFSISTIFETEHFYLCSRVFHAETLSCVLLWLRRVL